MLEKIYPTSRMLSSITGVPVPPNKAVVGANAFAHEAGIHQDGILKNPLTYEIILPEKVGVPARRLVLGKHSGRNALRARLDELGYQTTDAELADCYAMATAMADAEKEVTDRDLLSIIHQVRRSQCTRRKTNRRAAATADGAKFDNATGNRAMTGVRKTIAVLPGDGIGPEVTRAAVQFWAIAPTPSITNSSFANLPFGGDAIDRCGSPLPAETLAGCRSADAILLGAIGGPQVGIAAARKAPGSRSARTAQGAGPLHQSAADSSASGAARNFAAARASASTDCDFEIVRELAGDIYFGEHEIPAKAASARP